MRLLKGLSLAACLSLGGCAAMVVTGIPIESAAVSRSPDGKLTRWTGRIMGKLVGDSPFEWRKVGTDYVCKGATNSSGIGSATCSDGKIMPVEVPRQLYGSFSGSYVQKMPDGTLFASGWGGDADPDKLEKMLPPR